MIKRPPDGFQALIFAASMKMRMMLTEQKRTAVILVGNTPHHTGRLLLYCFRLSEYFDGITTWCGLAEVEQEPRRCTIADVTKEEYLKAAYSTREDMERELFLQTFGFDPDGEGFEGLDLQRKLIRPDTPITIIQWKLKNDPFDISGVDTAKSSSRFFHPDAFSEFCKTFPGMAADNIYMESEVLRLMEVWEYLNHEPGCALHEVCVSIAAEQERLQAKKTGDANPQLREEYV